MASSQESLRVEAQHQLYVRNQGYLLHPRISANLGPTARIADIGTGTGIWVQELASSAPPTWTFIGLDISGAQFPEESGDRRLFRLLNILDPIPDELQGQFDVVHLRSLILHPAGEDWQTIANHVEQLLKPGGWIQWEESDFPRMKVLQLVPGASTKNCQLLADISTWCHKKDGTMLDDVPELLEIVLNASFVGCREDLFSSDRDPEIRQQMSKIERMALYSMVKQLIESDAELGWTIDQLDRLNRRCQAELADGKVYYRWDIHVVIGRMVPGT